MYFLKFSKKSLVSFGWVANRVFDVSSGGVSSPRFVGDINESKFRPLNLMVKKTAYNGSKSFADRGVSAGSSPAGATIYDSSISL